MAPDTDNVQVINHPSYHFLGPAAVPTILRNDYRAMKRELFAFGKVSRQIRAEYRDWQANHFTAFVRIEELAWYMRIFFPNTDPEDPRSLQYIWNAPEIVFPWFHDGMYDVMPG